jgi:hypothetical protein
LVRAFYGERISMDTVDTKSRVRVPAISLPLVDSVASGAVTVRSVGMALGAEVAGTGGLDKGGITGSHGTVVVSNETVSAGGEDIGKAVSMDTVATNSRVGVLGISFPLVEAVSSVAVAVRSVGVALGMKVVSAGSLNGGSVDGSHGTVVVLHEAAGRGRQEVSRIDIGERAAVSIAVAAVASLSKAIGGSKVSAVLGRGDGHYSGKNDLKN